VEYLGFENLLYIEPDDNLSDILQSIIYGKELWRSFLIVAVILMLVETIIGRPNINALKRKPASH